MSKPKRLPIVSFVLWAALCLPLVGCGDGGGAGNTGKSGSESTQKKAEKPPEPEKSKPKKKVDRVARTFAKLRREAKSGRYAALLALGKFCAKHERYADEARRAFERILADDPEDEEALDHLGLALVEDLPMKKDAAVALKASAWFKAASGVVDTEVKNEQRLRDLGLSYAFQPPFLIVKEQEDDVAADRAKRRKLMRALEPLYAGFRSLLGDEVGLAAEPAAVVPIFWHRTKRAAMVFERSRQRRHDEVADRNYLWSLFDDSSDEESLAVRFGPLVEQASYSMVSATLNAHPMPSWLSTGLGGYLAGMSLDTKDARSMIDRAVVDPALIKAVLEKKDRWPVRRILAKPTLPDHLKKMLKEQGLEAGQFSFFASTSPHEAVAFVTYLAQEKPKTFTTLVASFLRGEAKEGLVKETLGDDLSALDTAWVKWMKETVEE